MRFGCDSVRPNVVLALLGVALALVRPAVAQELPRVTVTRELSVDGISVEPRLEDVVGLARVKFQGVIGYELSSIGYRLVDPLAKRDPAHPPLTLVGLVKEEICDDEAPSQCRIAVQWELQDPKGLVLYRVTTRAVAREATVDKLRRTLIEGVLHSLLQRRRFALQLTDADAVAKPKAVGPLGFKLCRRAALTLPAAARAVAASLVLVESGSSLARGSIVSGDGLILTQAGAIDPNAPLRVRFSAEQTLSAQVVALDRDADVALLHVDSHTDTTCLPLRDAPLAVGAPVFGVSSEPSEDSAVSLTGSVVQKVALEASSALLEVDARIARGDGGPLLDDEGRLAAVVSSRFSQRNATSARAVAVQTALSALDIKPAAITDPRLLDTPAERAPAVGYVRDRDDPPYVLTRRYTYGTSTTAHRIRTAGLVTAGIGAFGVAATWISFRGSPNLSSSGYNRTVVLNDLSWVLLGLGAVGFGASYAWPESHDTVGVQTATRRQLFIGLSAAGVELGGRM